MALAMAKLDGQDGNPNSHACGLLSQRAGEKGWQWGGISTCDPTYQFKFLMPRRLTGNVASVGSVSLGAAG
jgi:hypothetical protein